MKTNNVGNAFKYPDAVKHFVNPMPDNVMDYLFYWHLASDENMAIMTQDLIDLHDSISCEDGQFKTVAMTHEGAIHVMTRGIWEIPSLHKMNAIYFYHTGSANFIAINGWLNEIINSNKE